MELTDDLILSALTWQQAEKESYFSEIYQRHFRPIESFILKNGGNYDDARDIFQEVMIILLEKLRQPEFLLTSSLNTFLFAIARNLWLNKLKEKAKMNYCDAFEDFPEVVTEHNGLENEKKLYSWIDRITKHCQQIIKSVFFLKEPMINLAVRMGWKNQHTAQNQKYKCLQQIRRVKEKETSAI